jgi:predicted DNA-binding transcriptional regulator AlpA
MANSPQLLDFDDIAAMLGVSRGTARDKLTKRPDFPKPTVRISQRIQRWSRDDVLAWIKRVSK